MNLSLVTAQLTEPITLAEVKEHIRGIRSNAEDGLLQTLILSAVALVEVFTRRNLISRTWDLHMDNVPYSHILEIPNAPLGSVSSVTTYDENETPVVFSSDNYQVDNISEPGRIALVRGMTWPTTTLRPVNGFAVRFVAGYGGKGDVPDQIKHALLRTINFFYSERTSKKKKIQDMALPDEVKNILLPYKVWKV